MMNVNFLFGNHPGQIYHYSQNNKKLILWIRWIFEFQTISISLEQFWTVEQLQTFDLEHMHLSSLHTRIRPSIW